MIRAALSLAIILSPSIADAKQTKREKFIETQTAEQLVEFVKIEGRSQLDPSIWIDTRAILPSYGDDKWFRAHIDKATKKSFFQIYFKTSAGEHGLGLRNVTYLVGGKLRESEPTRVHFDVSCQRYGCRTYEDYVVTIERDAMDEAANGDGKDWIIKIFTNRGDGEIPSYRSEIKALLLAHDAALAGL